MAPPTPMSRRGSVLVYMLVGMVAFAGMVALAIDVSHVRVVKVQLQGAADAAARAAAAALNSGASVAQAAAVSEAALNKADGTSVVINPATDIDIGTFSNGVFTVQAGGTSVRVRCVRSAARGNAVASTIASYLGMSSSDVTATATVTGTPTPMAGFIGYGGVDIKNNGFFGGYNSGVTTLPTQALADSNMRVGSNAHVYTINNDIIDGDVVLGPSAVVSGPTVVGNTSYQSTALAVPTLPTWNPGTNPGSIPQVYSVSSNTVLPGGNYWFTSLTTSANLSFSGPTVLYVNGPIVFDSTVGPSDGIPSHLTIYQYGTNTFGDGNFNGMTLTAAVIAPQCDFVTKNNLYYAGMGIFNSIATKNNALFFYDEAQGPMNGSNTIKTVQ